MVSISPDAPVGNEPRYALLISSFLDPNPMTDLFQQTTSMNKSSNIAVGVSSTGEFIENDFVMKAYRQGLALSLDRSEWIIPSSVDEFRKWLTGEFSKEGERLFQISNWTTYVMFEDALLDVYMNNSMATVEIKGSAERVAAVQKRLASSPFQRAGSTINWVHGERGESADVPLDNSRKLIQSAYPWLLDPESGINNVDDYLEAFMHSSASVLVLIGPPGTGKTSLIRHMIQRLGASAMVAYDERIMSTDTLFANWIQSKHKFLVLEDSDAFLQARNDGNKMMHKFLNVSEGLVTVRGKKMIFSTNLPNVRDIDAALLRPGRCFGVPQFRALTADEARIAVKEIGSNLAVEDGKTYNFTQLFSGNNIVAPSIKRQGFGFTG